MKKYAVTKKFWYDGKQYFVRADTEVEAEIKKAMKIRDLEEGKVIISGNTTVADWSKQCIETYKVGISDLTRQRYEWLAKCCINKYIGNMLLKQVKPLHCQQVLNHQAGKSKYQIKQTRQFLNFIFKKAYENNLTLSNPAANLSEPAGTKTTRRALTEKEQDIFIDCAFSSRQFLVFLIMYYCGCRPSEARSVMGFDIEKLEGVPVLHIRGTKTEASDRRVPIPAALYDEIKDTPKFSLIAPNMAGSQHDKKSFGRAWSSLCRAMNIKMGCKMYRNTLVPPLPLADDLVPYCLRHTYCTNLQKQGVDLRSAQYLMGHADIAMTANIYTHADTSVILDAAKLIEGATKGATKDKVKRG